MFTYVHVHWPFLLLIYLVVCQCEHAVNYMYVAQGNTNVMFNNALLKILHTYRACNTNNMNGLKFFITIMLHSVYYCLSIYRACIN